MKAVLILLLLICGPLQAYVVEMHPAQIVYTHDGQVLMLYDGHLYELFTFHSEVCSCDIVFEVDDPDD